MRQILLTILLVLIGFTPAHAWADQVTLLPTDSQVQFRAYGFGLIPFDGKFTRFHGWIRYDPAHTQACQIVLEIEAASLAMDNETVRGGIMGPEFMDVTRFPDLAFHGACEGDGIAGTLLLHGETHPFDMDVDRSAHTIIASGRLHRAAWGMAARPFTAGSTIRIRVQLPNPANGPRT